MMHINYIGRPMQIVYEQPFNEHMRIYLRLEHLFKQLHEKIPQPSTIGSRAAMLALLKILTVSDRPDLKPKLTQSIAQQATMLAQLEQFDQVDPTKLKTVLEKLDHSIDYLHRLHGKIGNSLRNNPFLNQIRLHLNHPAGPCDFSTPAYALWLKQSPEKRTHHLQQWASELSDLGSIVQTILQLTRTSASGQKIAAHKGFYHQSLDPGLPYQMVRVSLPTHLNIYPEISTGKHRLTIRFLLLDPDHLDQTQQLSDNLLFQLTCCRF